MDCVGWPKFAQTYQSVKGLKYRLDELGGDWIANPELMFATLPSNMEQLSGGDRRGCE